MKPQGKTPYAASPEAIGMRTKRAEKQFYHDFFSRSVKGINLVLVTLPFAVCWFACYAGAIRMEPSAFSSAGILMMFAALYFFFGRTYDAFLISLKRISELFYSQLISIFMADAFMFLVLWLLMGSFPKLVPALCALTGQVFFSLLWCRYAHCWYFRHYGGQKTILVYDQEYDLQDLFGRYGLDKKFDILFSCSSAECLACDMKMLEGAEAVFLRGVSSHERNIILKYCVANNIVVYMIPHVGDVILSGAKRMHMFHLPFLRAGSYSPNPEYLFFKRAFDIVSSLAMLVAVSPLMLITAAAIKLQDGGPVFYRQTRLTKDAKQFQILKFRSMRVDAEKDGVARLSSGKQDERITPVGRVIRACRIDELPQLLNILAGSMSVVGPRPERPEIAERYERDMPEFSLRLQAKAGLTGYAQVYGKYNTQPYDKLQMDLMYLARPSFMEDMKIIFATFFILFMKESTEGIVHGQASIRDTQKKRSA